jgi:hypothetical protein
MMMRKICTIAFFMSVFLLANLDALTKGDLDRIIDYRITLKELDLSIQNHTAASINRDKFYIVNGTVASVSPDKANSFEFIPEDFLNPASFINRLRNKEDGLSALIFDSLSQNVQQGLKTFSAAADAATMVGNLSADLKKIMRKGSLLRGKPGLAPQVSSELRAFAERTLSQEETSCINRLVLEEAYPSDFRKYSVLCELAVSEWIGYEQIITYRGIVRLEGFDAFRFTTRQDPDNASREYIPKLSTIVAVARADKIIKFSDGSDAWQLDGIYIRQVK